MEAAAAPAQRKERLPALLVGIAAVTTTTTTTIEIATRRMDGNGNGNGNGNDDERNDNRECELSPLLVLLLFGLLLFVIEPAMR